MAYIIVHKVAPQYIQDDASAICFARDLLN